MCLFICTLCLSSFFLLLSSSPVSHLSSFPAILPSLRPSLSKPSFHSTSLISISPFYSFLFLNSLQVSNILEILKTNRFGSYTDSKNNAKDGITEKLRGDGLINSSAGVAFKVLITGKTITGLLLTPSPSPPMATAAEVVRVHTGGCDMGMTRVLFLLSLYNPVLSFWHEEDIEGEGKEGMRRKGRKRCGEVSVFDMAVAYNRDTAPMGELIYDSTFTHF